MNTTFDATPASAGSFSPTRTAGARWAWGGLLILEALLAFAPLAILGPAFGWPASLRNPAGAQLTAIAAQPGALLLGYGLYLLYSVLVAPAMIGLAAKVFSGLTRPVAVSIAVFAGLSALARSIGILRWLTVMPSLAQMHSGAGAPTRALIELVFDALTVYGGGIGELLGVSLFMALALGLLCAAAWRAAAMPASLAGLGLLTTLLLAAPAVAAFGVPLQVPVAPGVILLSIWMLAAGIWMLRAR